MPHIKVKPFETSILNLLIKRDNKFVFRAVGFNDRYEMLGVLLDDEQFMLEIKKRDDFFLIKSDIISRPLDSEKIKRVLALMIEMLELEVVHSNIEIHPHKPLLADRYNKKIRDFEQPIFTRDKIAIEVGFGSGRHLLYQAKENPDTLFIGIEIHTPSAQQVLKQIALQGLENIWVVNYDARLLMEMMPSNICTNIYVHFPVPWDKKPHRRVIGDRFIEESMRVLEQGGKLELRTDSDNYYMHALEIFSKPDKIDFRVEKNRNIAVTSKYEDRWKAKQKDIYTLTVYSESISAQKNRNYSFVFKNEATVKSLLELPDKAIVEDEFFVHFERGYKIAESDDMIIRCAFGSFDKPEHKYLIQNGNNIQYYPQTPVKTEVNFLAHQKIGEFIYG